MLLEQMLQFVLEDAPMWTFALSRADVCLFIPLLPV